MSASRSPTRSPMAARPSARLTATVDLPTPPLPEATAMIERTPGTSGLGGAPRAWGCPGPGRGLAGGLLRGQHRRHRQHARQGLDGLLRRLAQRLELGSALRVDLDGETDMPLAQLHARDHAE